LGKAVRAVERAEIAGDEGGGSGHEERDADNPYGTTEADSRDSHRPPSWKGKHD